jgi:hypothetical protein
MENRFSIDVLFLQMETTSFLAMDKEGNSVDARLDGWEGGIIDVAVGCWQVSPPVSGPVPFVTSADPRAGGGGQYIGTKHVYVSVFFTNIVV